LLSILGCQVVDPGSSRVSVRGFTSSLDITTSGSSGTKLVALKLDWILSFENDLLNTGLKASRKALLLIWLTPQFAKALTSYLYARFNSTKQPTLSS
jgi:hypothetical protein